MKQVCSICKREVTMTMTFTATGPGIPKREPTPPICSPCFKRRTTEMLAKLKRRKP